MTAKNIVRPFAARLQPRSFHFVTAFLVCAVSFVAIAAPVAAAQRRHKRPAGKSKTHCSSQIRDITGCPDTGCGGSYDPQLNKRKNLKSDNHFVRAISFAEMQNLPDPAHFTAKTPSRDELRRLGEGRKIRVVALALVARKGSAESCNCGLTAPKDTDNHIVLVDPALRNPTLEQSEKNSQTAEFTPRVRLSHPNFRREVLQPLIARNKGHLLVRVTGLQMFDSEHFLRRHLKRYNNWEVHPVLKMEYCANGATCSDGSDAGWVDLDRLRPASVRGAASPVPRR